MSKINEKLRIHKRLDARNKKWIEIVDTYGDFSGYYISHKHNFKKGTTSITFKLINEWYGGSDYHPNKVVTHEYTDKDLIYFVRVDFIN